MSEKRYREEFQYLARHLLPVERDLTASQACYAETCGKFFANSPDPLFQRMMDLNLDPEAVELAGRSRLMSLRQKIYIFFLSLEVCEELKEAKPTPAVPVFFGLLALGLSVLRSVRKYFLGRYLIRSHDLF